ncbi:MULTISPECIES: sensor histidine kinase [Lysobacter]|uniref:sensor histidine kinase n=1 Tax=Lysobacter TaxID=68 RepID=UPI001F2A2214|nr:MULTISPECIES: histidine kinase [Lysobacter]UJB17403.1 histidine kinase [Lysobacter capsici]UJQ28874.1 histidine kinase [Lysobacter gummosus]
MLARAGSPMTPSRPGRRMLPPFWLPVLAGLPLGACLLVMAIPILGHGNATLARTLYLSAFVLWVLPLTLLQRRLWRRGLPVWRIALILLAATYLMALATRLLSIALQTFPSGQLARLTTAGMLDASLLLRGLEGAWLVLVAYCAVHAVVTYYAELRREQAEHLEARALASDAELRALRYQLQPHFLFNTLNAISTLVAEERGAQARQMLARLGDFLRCVLQARQGHEIALAEEIAMTDTYLEIEKARLGQRLVVSWHLGDGVLAAQVPCLLLQPLVENAIRHGIAPRSAPGRIDIRIARDAACLDIRIGNDLPAPGESAPRDDGCGETVGLDNVRARIARLYPDRATLHAGIDDDGRYQVRMMLPFSTEPVHTGPDRIAPEPGA